MQDGDRKRKRKMGRRWEEEEKDGKEMRRGT